MAGLSRRKRYAKVVFAVGIEFSQTLLNAAGEI